MRKVGSQKGEVQIEAWTSEQKTMMIQVQGVVKAMGEDMIHPSTLPTPQKKYASKKRPENEAWVDSVLTVEQMRQESLKRNSSSFSGFQDPSLIHPPAAGRGWWLLAESLCELPSVKKAALPKFMAAHIQWLVDESGI